MKNERKFSKCSICGNIVSYINHAGPDVICCGQKMQEIKPNTTDAATEKHVPVPVRDNSKLTVNVGSAPHPMTPEHHIAWIATASGNRTQRVVLPNDMPASAEFAVSGEPVTVYAYCNLHGLWAAEG